MPIVGKWTQNQGEAIVINQVAPTALIEDNGTSNDEGDGENEEVSNNSGT